MTRPCHAASLPNVNRTRIDIHFPKISSDGHLNTRPATTRVSSIPADTLELDQAEKMLNSPPRHARTRPNATRASSVRAEILELNQAEKMLNTRVRS